MKPVLSLLLIALGCAPGSSSSVPLASGDASDDGTEDNGGTDGSGQTDAEDGTDGTLPCDAPGDLSAAEEAVSLEHWQGADAPEASVALSVVRPACERFVAQGNPAWLQPTVAADGSAVSITLDPGAGLTSGIHTGYVSLRDASDPAVLVEIAVTVRAWMTPEGGGSPKVLVIGIDGLDGDELSRIETPTFARLAAGGLWTHAAQTQLEADTYSGPGWASILTGVDADKHQITTNGGYDGRDTAWPSFSWRARQSLGLSTAAAIQWSPITEIYEDDALDATASGDMATVAAQMAGQLRSGLHDVHFVHLDDVDGAGHSTGFTADSATYTETVQQVDAILADLLDAVLSRPGIEDENWLIAVTSDHGGLDYNHGCRTADCRNIPLYFAGASLPAAALSAPSSHLDVHPTVMAFLGLPVEDLDLDGTSWIATEADCNNGLDDDGDGLADCEDRDCEDDETCWECPAHDLGTAVGTDLWTGIADRGGFFEGSCGGAGWEQTFAWRAAEAGWYSLDTVGVYSDTVLTVVDGDCGGAELACNDDVTGVRSGLAVDLDAGQEVVAVVDAANPEEVIDVTLSVYPFDQTCPHGDLGSSLGATSGVVPQTDTAWIGGGCPPAVGGVQHTWTAPETDTWTFSSAGSSFDTVLYVSESCDGGDATLACNDDSGGFQSQASVALAAGQEVVVTVGAFDARFGDGSYTLTVSR